MNRRTDAIASACADFLLRWRKALFAGMALLFLASLFLCTRIRVDAGVTPSFQVVDGLRISTGGSFGNVIMVGLGGAGDPVPDGEHARLGAKLEEGRRWWNIRAQTGGALGDIDKLLFSGSARDRLFILELSDTAPGTEWYPFLAALRTAFPGVHISGPAYVKAYIESEILREAPRLLVISSLILFIAYFAMFRSLSCAARLWLASLVPAIMTAAIFPVMNRPMTIYGVVAPVCALAISTAYCVHSTRGLEETGGDLHALFALKGPPIFLDYLTTFLGFGTLVPTGNPELAVLGNATIFGTTVAFIVGFFLLPLTDPRLRSHVRRERDAPRAEEALTPRAGAGGGLRIPACLALALVFAILFSGWGRLGYRASSVSALSGRSAVAKDALFFERKFGAMDEIVLRIDTGRENGIVDLKLYRALESLHGDLARDPLVYLVYDYTDAVDSILSSYAGGTGKAASEEEIGEAIELFGSSSLAPYGGLIHDASWRTASIRIRLNPEFEGKELLEALARWQKAARDRGVEGDLSWAGDSASFAASNLVMSRSQFWNVLVYFASIFLVLLLVTRSPFRSAIIVLPPIAAIFAAVGLAGLLGWPLDSGSALGLAIIAGIGIDDALVYVLTKERTALTRRSVIEASIILIATLSSFLTSSFSLITQVYILVSVGLVLSTSVVLIVIPALEGLYAKWRLRHHGMRRPL